MKRDLEKRIVCTQIVCTKKDIPTKLFMKSRNLFGEGVLRLQK